MKLTVVQSVSNNGSLELVRSSNHSIRCHLRSSCFPLKNLNVVSSKISTLVARLSPISPDRCMVPKLAIIPAFEMISTNAYARSQNTCPNSKPISEATKKNVPASYQKNKGDIRRVWRAAFPILVVIGTASSYYQAVFRTV